MTDARMRISEVYLSIQGEGPRVGCPTVFVRSAGCNLRCPGWPCDTPHAIEPSLFRVDSKFLTSPEVLEEVEKVAGAGGNICFTGGEPFLQNSKAFESTVVALAGAGYTTQEVFTNGTLEFPDWAFDWLLFILDWKLTGSGEEVNIMGTEGVQTTRMNNFTKLSAGDVVKFTIASRKDYEEAKYWFKVLQEYNAEIDFIYGVVWGKLEASELIGWVLEDELIEWTYSHQLHNVIWDRTKRGI